MHRKDSLGAHVILWVTPPFPTLSANTERVGKGGGNRCVYCIWYVEGMYMLKVIKKGGMYMVAVVVRPILALVAQI